MKTYTMTALVVSLVYASLAHSEQLSVLSKAASALDSLEILVTYQIISVAEPSQVPELQKARQLDGFRKLVEAFKHADTARWIMLQDRMQFCRVKGYQPLDKDVRVPMVLRHGAWTSEWVEPMLCSDDTCLTWIYTYAPNQGNPNGLSVVCEGGPREKFPSRLFSMERAVAKAAGPLYPFVMPTLLPNWGTDFQTLSVGVTVTGDQLSQPTLDNGVLQMQLEVFERSNGVRGVLVANDETATNLQALRAILAKSDKSQWHSRGAQGYLSCQLTPGEYTIVLEVAGDHLNTGRVTVDLDVQRSPTMSDVVLIRDVAGTGLDPGVMRGSENFYGISRPEFVDGTDVSIRMEFELPGVFNGRYRAWATLSRIPEVRSRSERASVNNMEVLYWEDEAGNPKYGSTLPAELFRDVQKDRNLITLLDQTFTTESDLAIFLEPVVLDAKPGQYVLSVQITDGKKRLRYLGMKSVVIQILPH